MESVRLASQAGWQMMRKKTVQTEMVQGAV